VKNEIILQNFIVYGNQLKSLPLVTVSIFTVIIILSGPVFAATLSAADINWWNMAMMLFGGLALFLFGMDQMADALKAVAGHRMKNILARLTTNRFMGAITGAFVTAVIQSSSVTTVLVVGFITAGLMSMSQSIGIIMGANIGTTITAQIVAFKVTKAALLMIAVGFSLMSFSKKEKIIQYGAMLMGLGMIFFGMSVMSNAMTPLRNFQPFLDLMTQMETPLIGILIAAAFTGLIQSSSATTGIVIVMASQGFITLPAGIALVFGSNIGTCVTALLATIGKPREALRAAMVHVLFNVFGVIIWLAFINYLAAFVTVFSPAYPELAGANRLAAEVPRQIANAHTVFNISNTLIFIGFAGVFARFVEWMIPDKPLEEIVLTKPIYLDKELLDTPSLAIEGARMEVRHMGEHVTKMLEDIISAITKGDRSTLNNIAQSDEKVDILYAEIINYLGQISQKPLPHQLTQELFSLMDVVNDLENIGDTIETDLVHLGRQRLDADLTISNETINILNKLHHIAINMTKSAIAAVVENDIIKAQENILTKDKFDQKANEATAYLAERLVVDEPDRLACYTLEVDIIERLKRVVHLTKRISASVESAQELLKYDS
jgi:phosphate:Na+ symporter